METLKVGSKNLLKNSVLILPMRNGNDFSHNIYKKNMKGSYPTYEEWKLLFQKFVQKRGNVLILPMRNGNFSSNAIPTRDALFLSYL